MITYKGATYEERPFTESYQHIEPCWDCSFGKRINLGPREIKKEGVPTTVMECGFACKRPKDFPAQCTCMQRADKKNVYFVKVTSPKV